MQIVRVAEDVAEVSAQGGLFDVQGGTVSLALGGSYRREAFTQVTDAQSQEIRTGAGIGAAFPAGLVNTLGGFERTNPQPTRGTYNVKEAFLETEVPLFKDLPAVRSLTFNAAGRYVDYSTSGGVEPWKLGLVYEPVDGLRVRASRSTDIRAPNLGELYQGSSQGTSTVQDPANGNVTTNVITGAIGNTGLVPESANTSTIGVVVTPDSLFNGLLSGLEFSLDYYQINISKRDLGPERAAGTELLRQWLRPAMRLHHAQSQRDLVACRIAVLQCGGAPDQGRGLRGVLYDAAQRYRLRV